MHANQQLLTDFYEAFSRRDHEKMVACYHDQVHFSDPVFPELHGARAGAMWHMLCERGKDLRLEFSGIEADDKEGRAHWEAWYTFSATGKKVHNIIEARFAFRDGLIVDHKDEFDLYRWCSQAMGVTGKLLGWTPILQGAVRKKAGQGLEQFIQKKGLA